MKLEQHCISVSHVDHVLPFISKADKNNIYAVLNSACTYAPAVCVCAFCVAHVHAM